MRQAERAAEKVARIVFPAATGNATDINQSYRVVRGANQLDQLDYTTPRLRIIGLGADVLLGLIIPLGLSVGGSEVMTHFWDTPAVANILGETLIFSGSKAIYNQALAPRIVDKLAGPLMDIIPDPSQGHRPPPFIV